MVDGVKIGAPSRNASLEEQTLAVELALKELDLKAKQEETKSRSRFLGRINITIPQATLIVGVLTFLGSFLGTYFQQANQIDLKNREFAAQLNLKQREIEGQLILGAIKDQDAQQALNRLRFLIDAGFVADADGRISTLIMSGKYGSGLGAPSSASVLKALVSGRPPLIIQEIVAISGRRVVIDFEEQADFVPIAAAMKQKDGRATLLYDARQIAQLEQDKKNNWTVAAILAHEVGHIVLGHLDSIEQGVRCLVPPDPKHSSNCISLTDLELAADAYAGFVLRRLGASLEESQRAFDFIPDTPFPDRYPGRKQRTQAIAKGWNGSNPVH